MHPKSDWNDILQKCFFIIIASMSTILLDAETPVCACLDLNVEVCKSWWWCHFIGLNTKSSCWTELRVNYKKLKFFSSFHSILIFCWCSLHWLFLPAPSKSIHLTSEWSWRLWGFKRGNVPQNIWIIYLVEWMLMAHEHEGVGVSRGVSPHAQNCGGIW